MTREIMLIPEKNVALLSGIRIIRDDVDLIMGYRGVG